VFLGVVRREVRAKSGEASSSHLQGVIPYGRFLHLQHHLTVKISCFIKA
jgi:hypothetical protein